MCPPKRLEKTWSLKCNKTKKIEDPLHFQTTPCNILKEFENDFASMNMVILVEAT
jgi:hypothetical protein